MAIRLLANQNLSENEVLNLMSEHKDSKGKQIFLLVFNFEVWNLQCSKFMLHVSVVDSNPQECFTFDQFHDIVSKYLQSPDNQNHKNGFNISKSNESSRFELK